MSKVDILDALKQISLKSKEYGDISCAGALKGKSSGATVALDDVSPLGHKVGVKLRSKNLFDISKIQTTETITNNGDGSLTLSQYANFTNLRLKDLAPALKVGDIAVLSVSYDSEPSYKAILLKEPNIGWNFGNVMTITEDMLNSSVYLYGNRDNVTVVTLSNIQIELGTTATAYVPYVADDTEIAVKSCGQNILNCSLTHDTLTQNGITYTNNGDGTITANGTATSTSMFGFNISVIKPDSKDTVSFILSGCPNGGSEDTYSLSNLLTKHNDTGNGIIANGIPIDRIDPVIYIKEGTKVENLVFKPQLVISNKELVTSTPIPTYEPYIEGETVTTTLAEGAELQSVAPNMTILTKKAGVVIDVSYNKDANKVIEKLTQAIVSLGGNI